MASDAKPKTKAPRKPTIKQRRAVAELVENGGNVSKAMLAAGYSPATANTPQKLTESEYVQDLMREVGLTDKDGFLVLKQGLSATKELMAGKEAPDYQTRHKYMESLFRLRGLGVRQDQSATTYNFVNIAKDDSSAFNI